MTTWVCHLGVSIAQYTIYWYQYASLHQHQQIPIYLVSVLSFSRPPPSTGEVPSKYLPCTPLVSISNTIPWYQVSSSTHPQQRVHLRYRTAPSVVGDV